jgi:tetratricopeptide (TPR) repeat protein
MPDDPTILALRAEALIARRDWPSLDALALDWTRRQPDNVAGWRAGARAAFELGRYRGASDAFARVLALTTPTAADLTTYGSLCLHALDIDAAAAALDQAEALDPDYAELLSTRGLLNMYLGRFKEAEECCRRSLARNPDNVPAYTTLSRLRRGRLTDEDRDAVARLAQRPDLNLDYRIPAAFAIAHAHDANAQFDQAFHAYEYAHGLALERDRLEHRRYDRVYVDERRRRLIELSLEPALTKENSAGGPVPIFIFGMPRSGTTLIESMLSAHSRIFACGERPTMRQILQALLALDAAARAPDVSLLRDWAAAYMSQLPKIGGADHVTDKHPLNFEAVGLITRIFPDARLIHVRRNPIETGLSIYRQEFNKNWTFPHRLPDIGHYYGHYARLIAHWEQVLPGRITTIQYEDFARSFESQAPALVAACGLGWEPGCLDFQHTARAITTFSTVQARDPVAVTNGRARRYQRHLTALVAALEEAGIDLETGALRS